MKSVMSHNFSQVPQANIPRSRFNRDHGHKTTFDSGYLIPILVDEVLPGDTFECSMTGFARLATPIFPVMDNAYMDTHFFAVPNRLVWDNWKRFNGERDNPTDAIAYTVPHMLSPASVGHLVGSLSDYFGIPTGIPALKHSALWHRAYNLIYNEWFRDQNLQSSLVVSKTDGPDFSTNYVLKRRGKRHDYFTSCLPFPQKGDDVTLPLTGNARLSLDESVGPTDDIGIIAGDGSPLLPRSAYGMEINSGDLTFDNLNQVGLDNIAYADLASVTGVTVNALREAFQIQRLLERDARGGTRYTEIIRSHFGVTSPDARLQRPEYLGGGSSPILFTPVSQTSATTDTETPLATLSSYATASLDRHGFVKSFTEHCLIIGLVSVRADLTYQQGLNKMFSRETRYDYYLPVLSHLGEQAVLNKEIYAQGNLATTDDAVFGYQERYAEYRYKPSIITGKFRSTYATSLDSWHLSQEFSTLPELNSTFIEENPPFSRVIAVDNEPEFIFDSFFKYRCTRPIPTYAVPGKIDHF